MTTMADFAALDSLLANAPEENPLKQTPTAYGQDAPINMKGPAIAPSSIGVKSACRFCQRQGSASLSNLKHDVGGSRHGKFGVGLECVGRTGAADSGEQRCLLGIHPGGDHRLYPIRQQQ